MRVTRTLAGAPLLPNEGVTPPAPETTCGSASEPCIDASAASSSSPGPPPFAQFLRGLGGELDRGESIAQRAIHAGNCGVMSPEQLIALQAGIYRYSEAVDLVTKLVDKGTQAVRTTLQNQ